MTKKAGALKVGDRAYLSGVGFPYEKLEGHPCKILAVNVGDGGRYVYAEVFSLEKGKTKRERFLFFPSVISRERNSGILALWKELETAQKKLAKINRILEKIPDWAEEE
jgi:hypothetical protein